MDNIDHIIENSNVQPRPYQKRIISKVYDLYHGDYVHEQTGQKQPQLDSIMIESPTGSGKTVMALMIAKLMQMENPDLVISWVAMRRNLLKQSARENESKGINVENAHWISMFDHSPEELLSAKAAGKKVMLIIDEAQHDAASSMAHLHNLIQPDYVLGMTATPFRTDRMKLCFQKVIKDCGIHQLIQDGYLAPYHHYTIPKWGINDIVEHYCADVDKWGKSIFFFLTLDECFQFSNELAKRGVLHEVVKGGQQKVTDRQLEMFENDEINVLVNCMVLTEGFDCPSLKTAWIRDSTKGPTMQMAGRAFRQHPSFSHKQVVQSKMTAWPFPKTALPDEQYLLVHDEWRSLKLNPMINDISNHTLKVIANTEVVMPQFVVNNRKRSNKIRF